MITIKVNGKKTKIKTFNELNVSEYIRLTEIEKKAGELNVVDYLTVVLKLDSDAVFNLQVKNSGFIMQSIGTAVDFRNITPPKILKVGIRAYWLKNYSIDTVGKRFFFSKKHKDLKNDEQVLVYSLALALSTKNDITETNKLYQELFNENYIHVLSAGWFFFLNLTNGWKQGKKNLKTFLQQIRMLVIKRRLELKG